MMMYEDVIEKKNNMDNKSLINRILLAIDGIVLVDVCVYVFYWICLGYG